MFGRSIENEPKAALRDCTARLASEISGRGSDGGLMGILSDLKDILRAMPEDNK